MPRGGPRPNSGGARPGAGRKPKEKAVTTTDDPAEFLRMVMQGAIDPTGAQLDAAKALVRSGVIGGKRARDAAKAKDAAGKFKPRPAPLKLVSGG